MPDNAIVDVTIRLDADAASRLEEIVKAAHAIGLRNIARHDRFLILNGRIRADRLDRLSGVPGIASVRPDETYRTQSPSG